MDQRVHRDDVVEVAEAEHVADAPIDAAADEAVVVESRRRALAGDADELCRDVDRRHARAAPRRRDGERAGAAAGSSRVRPVMSPGSQASSVGASRRARRGPSRGCG